MRNAGCDRKCVKLVVNTMKKYIQPDIIPWVQIEATAMYKYKKLDAYFETLINKLYQHGFQNV